jgi:adenosylcobyric acid synthase
MTSQIILKGKAIGTVSATDYYEQYFELGWQTIKECLECLSTDYEVLVCEGAGSPAEINLKHRDLTNMRVAKHLNATTLLVVDIDRGGSFAHVVGTLELLDPDERALIKGVVINKFRGQRSILEPGIKWLEERTGIPVVGVIPYLEQVFPAEDSLDLLERKPTKANSELNIAVIRLPRIANFTDFDPLESEPSVTVKYLHPKQDLGHPDAVIIPGTKTSIGDLIALQKSGMAEAIQNYAASGGTVLGICGGFQMLGQFIADPEANEGQAGRYQGLNLLPIQTVITDHKIARQRQVTSNYPQAGLPVTGFEIHQGRTRIENSILDQQSYQPLFDNVNLGLVDSCQSVWGTYLHGIFDNGPWRRAWLNRLRQQRGLKSLPTGVGNYREQREQLLESLGNHIEEHLDLTPFI